MKVYKSVLVLLTAASTALCYCPPDKSYNTGRCAYRFQCNGNIRGIRLPNQCQESTNYNVTVDVTLTEAIERFDDNLDRDFLGFITTLRIYGRWKETKLAILQYTPKLQHFYFSNNGIETITDSPFFYLSRLETVDLSRNRLTEIGDIFQFEMHPNRLKKLSLSYNAIEELPSYAFIELTSLTELDLSYNLISDLTEEPFHNLTILETLRLNNNRIKDLNGAVNNLQILKHLYLRGNQIENIDVESLKIIMDLETFDVSGNNLEKIKPDLFSRHWDHFSNHSVCKIILSENHIVFVPNGTSKEISSRFVRHLGRSPIDILTEVDLSRNSITNIEYNAFQSLVHLISLDLSRNKIINFHINADDLALLKNLNLSNNYITQLYYESFSSMNKLENLDLSYNRLDYIPDMTFNNNYNLQRVNMTYNEIEKLDGIRINMFHREGGVLDLSNNGLFKLRIPSGEGLRLYTLILRSNNITDLALIDLTYQTDLKFLHLTNNLITELNHTSLHFPQQVILLDLNCNKIQRIGPSAFHKLGHLQTLRLRNNFLREIEYGAFQGLSALQKLDLSFNKISYLDSKLLMDLKSLEVLSIRSNGMNVLDYKYWFGHNIDLTVFLDNNEFSCDWLGTALSDYHIGYSRMKPTVLVTTNSVNSLEGIPCKVADSEALTEAKLVMMDERLLVTSQKILEAVKDQNLFLKRFIFRERGADITGKV